MVGLAGLVEALVCWEWWQTVDIHDSEMSIPLSVYGVGMESYLDSFVYMVGIPVSVMGNALHSTQYW